MSRLLMIPLLTLVPLAGSATVQPLVTDAGTLILYHCDDAAGQNLIADSSGKGNQGVLGTGTGVTPVVKNVVPAAAATGFGTALSLGVNDGVGVDFNKNGTWAFEAQAGDVMDMSLLGTDATATFTLEAMVNLPSLTSTAPMHIWSGDSGAATRPFQFRINGGSVGFTLIEAGNKGAFTFDLKTVTGTHAFVANQWFHVAMVYDGSGGAANAVVRFYWTRVDSGATQANLVATSPAGTVQWDDNVDGPMAFGNDSRSNGGFGEGIQGRIDEGRVSTVARAASDFIFKADLTDTDGDGLPDYWETANGLNPADDGTQGESSPGAKDGPHGAAGDLDGDGHSNLAEYQAGSAPNNAASVPGDLDGDGLTDAWEQSNFGNLAQTAAGDPDADGFNNLAEQAAGSNPRNPVSVPGDIDGDGMADAWEQLHYGNLAQLPYDDPDGDGYSQLAESIAGTDPKNAASHPSWKSPGVGLMSDTVPATNACIMPSNATYGRAINGISFQDQILTTFNGYQYTAWYDSVGSIQRVVLARRTVAGTTTGPWQTYQTDSEFTNGDESSWDAHNVIAIGICPQDGTLHFSWDHHGHTLRYRRSVAGLCTTNTAAWGAGMLNPEQNWLVASGTVVPEVTYPQFVDTPTGGLAITWRNGASGNGDQLLSFYRPATRNWTTPVLYIQRGGTYSGTGSTSRCPYINGFDFSPDGTIHVTWTWREGAGSSNHDICYAYSQDNGVTWKNSAGTTIANTATGGFITLDTPGITFKPTDLNQLLINQQTQCVDGEGRVHAMMLHRREEPAYAYPNITTAVYSTLATAYYHYFRDPGAGRWQQRRLPPEVFPVGSRPSIGYDAAGNLYAAFTTYNVTTSVFPGYTSGRLAVASASKASRYTDWRIVQVLDVPYQFTGEPLLDQPRLLNDGILSVYLQENSASSAAGATSLHVYEFVTGVPEPVLPMQAGILPTGSTAVITVEGELGSSYQLQTSTDPGGAWTPVGTALAGRGGLLAFPNPSGMADPKRFYRIVKTTP